MGNYLETIYFRNEYGEDAYPQKLCNYIAEHYFSAAGPCAGKTVLDIGSGKGNHLVGFSRKGMKAFGLDKRPECVEALKEFDIRSCDIERDRFPYENNFFDCIYSKSVLEHVTNTDNFLKEALRVLKPGGVAVFMTPDWRSQHEFFWDYTHVKAFTRKSLQDALMINGYERVVCRYFLQLPLVWKYPWTEVLTRVIALLPDSLKWRDSEEKDFRRWIRFSKEKMLLAVGYKPHA
ncbi:MAG TPA: methyltransferase domain-containing protein [Candidatus Bathyarchaeia archaeon]|nr:methyltransferase domain-containing protein [Candidatus Bathyarchaeia archaeon]